MKIIKSKHRSNLTELLRIALTTHYNDNNNSHNPASKKFTKIKN